MASAGGASWRAAVADRPRRDDDPSRRGGGGHGPGARHDRGTGPGRPGGRPTGGGPGRGPRPPFDAPARRRATPAVRPTPFRRATTTLRPPAPRRAGPPSERPRPSGGRPSRGHRPVAVATARRTTVDRSLGGSARRPAVLAQAASGQPDHAQDGTRQGPPGDRPWDDHRRPTQRGPWTGPPDRPVEPGRSTPDRRPGGYRSPGPDARTRSIRPGPGPSGRALGSIRAQYGRPAGPPSRPAYAPPALPPPDVLGPDEELVAGRRPVEEAFVARRPAHRLLVVPQRRQALEKLVLHATSLRLPIVELEGGSLTALAGFDGHQGVALVVEPRRFATLEEILARAAERGEAPFILALDSLEDPAERRDAPAQRRGGRRPRRAVPDPSTGALDAIRGEGLGGRGRASPVGTGR